MSQYFVFPAGRSISRIGSDEVGALDGGSRRLREPVVITDGAGLMSEVWRWTPNYLREHAGAVELPATLPGPDGRFRYEPGRTLDSQPVSVARFFDDVADPDGPRWCFQQVAVERDLPDLAARLDLPAGVPRPLVKAVNLWLAAPDTTTPLHYDDTHNLFAQVSGAKTFHLFPPEALDALYPGPLNTGAQHVSGVDLFRPDLGRHPLAASLVRRTVTVEAGEALLLPAFWWHQVVSPGVSVSVNFWWKAHAGDCLCPGFLRQLRSAAVQEDLAVLTGSFVLGDAADPVEDAAGLVRLLVDLGEARAALALALSVLRALKRRSVPAAGDLLTRYEPAARTSAPSTDEITRLADDLVMIVS